MTRHPLFGLLLAAAAALLLSPDTLLMRMSGLDGAALMAWRGTLTGAVLLAGWIFASRAHRRDLGTLLTAAGAGVVLCQFVNATTFSVAVAVAPVSVVLFGVATVPVWAAVFAWVFMGERTGWATWVTIVSVLTGIALAVFGQGGDGFGLDLATMFGALGGLIVASMLSLTFVLLRAHGGLPILLTLGLGALLTGATGLILSEPGGVWDGSLWPIAISGGFILPASFFMLSVASRFTPASNVSLMLLLETALGSLLVWIGVGEAVSGPTLLGGIIVIVSLATYLLHGRRVARRG